MIAEIEIELRGLLTKRQYDGLSSILKDKGTYVEHKHRLLLDYSTFLDREGIKDRKTDIRLRTTNGQPEIITKLGGWGGDEHRREISIKTEVGSFDKLVETYGILGYIKAIVAERFTEVYTYSGFEFALVTVPNHSYYFEIEKMAGDASEVELVKDSMRKLCREFELELFTDESFYQYIETLNRESNGVFDFSNFEPDYFATRFKI